MNWQCVIVSVCALSVCLLATASLWRSLLLLLLVEVYWLVDDFVYQYVEDDAKETDDTKHVEDTNGAGNIA